MFVSMGYSDNSRNDAMDANVAGYLAGAIPSGDYLGWLVVAPRGEVVAGCGLSIMRLPGKPFNVSGYYSYLMSVYVEPEHRRQGIARHLTRMMVDWSREHGVTEIRLHASAQGQPVYESLGFRVTNEMRLTLEEQ